MLWVVLAVVLVMVLVVVVDQVSQLGSSSSFGVFAIAMRSQDKLSNTVPVAPPKLIASTNTFTGYGQQDQHQAKHEQPHNCHALQRKFGVLFRRNSVPELWSHPKKIHVT